MSDWRDRVIEQFAADEAELIERLVDSMIKTDVWRQLAKAAIEHAHSTAAERDRLRAAHQRLIDEYRALRVETIRRSEAA